MASQKSQILGISSRDHDENHAVSGEKFAAGLATSFMFNESEFCDSKFFTDIIDSLYVLEAVTQLADKDITLPNYNNFNGNCVVGFSS